MLVGVVGVLGLCAAVPAMASAGVSIAASPTAIDPTQTSTVTATTTHQLQAEGLWLTIFDVTSSPAGGLRALCTSMPCTVTDYMDWSENTSPRDRRYEARVVPAGNQT